MNQKRTRNKRKKRSIRPHRLSLELKKKIAIQEERSVQEFQERLLIDPAEETFVNLRSVGLHQMEMLWPSNDQHLWN